MPGWGLVLESHGRGGRPRLGRFVNQNQNLAMKHGRRVNGWLRIRRLAILGTFLHLLEDLEVPSVPLDWTLTYTVRSCSALVGVQGRKLTGRVLLCTCNSQWPKTAIMGQSIPGSAGTGVSRASFPRARNRTGPLGRKKERTDAKN